MTSQIPSDVLLAINRIHEFAEATGHKRSRSTIAVDARSHCQECQSLHVLLSQKDEVIRQQSALIAQQSLLLNSLSTVRDNGRLSALKATHPGSHNFTDNIKRLQPFLLEQITSLTPSFSFYSSEFTWPDPLVPPPPDFLHFDPPTPWAPFILGSDVNMLDFLLDFTATSRAATYAQWSRSGSEACLSLFDASTPPNIRFVPQSLYRESAYDLQSAADFLRAREIIASYTMLLPLVELDMIAGTIELPDGDVPWSVHPQTALVTVYGHVEMSLVKKLFRPVLPEVTSRWEYVTKSLFNIPIDAAREYHQLLSLFLLDCLVKDPKSCTHGLTRVYIPDPEDEDIHVSWQDLKAYLIKNFAGALYRHGAEVERLIKHLQR